MDNYNSSSRRPFASSHDGSLWKSVHPQSSICDSGTGTSLSNIDRPPCPPKLFGGAEDCGEESGIFSGDIHTETDGNVDAVPPQVEQAVTATSHALERISISRAEPSREMMATVRTDRPTTRQTAQRTRGARQVRVRRPHRNFSNVAMPGVRSTSPSAGVQSMPDNSGNNLSGGFVASHGSLPQSWDSSGYGTQSSLTSVDVFSGSSSGTLPWPSIDIFELQQNVQYFLPNRDGDT